MPANQCGEGQPTVVHDLDGLQNVAQSRQIGEIDGHVAAVRVHRNPSNLHGLASLRTVDTLAERSVEIGEKGRVALAGRHRDKADEGRVEKLRLILAAVVCIESARLDVAFPIAGLELRGGEKRNAVADPEKRTSLCAAFLRYFIRLLRANSLCGAARRGPRSVLAVAQVEETGLRVAAGIADSVAQILVLACV